MQGSLVALTGELALTVSEHKKCSLFSEDLCSVHTVSSVQCSVPLQFSLQ